MAEHSGGGKDPITSIGGTLIGGAMGIFSGILVLGLILGGITGNVPIRASLFDVWAWGQLFGGWINAGGNSAIQTFGDEKYFQNSKKIGSDTKPEQRLMQAPKTNGNILPASDRSQSLNISTQSSQQVSPYEDLDGNGSISIEEVAQQNKARNR